MLWASEQNGSDAWNKCRETFISQFLNQSSQKQLPSLALTKKNLVEHTEIDWSKLFFFENNFCNRTAS